VLVSLDVERDRMDDAHSTSDSDPAADSSTDLGRLLAERDRQRTRDYAALGLDPPR
jgi:hypothetical protein